MKRLSTLQLALSYAGMFFGAGFVSGQEIRQFFSVYGTAGLFGLILSALLFFLLGAAFFDAAREEPDQTVGELLIPGYHPVLSGAVEAAEDIMLFGVVVIMTAGAGAMARQVAGLPAAAAGLVFSAAVFLMSLRNVRAAVAVFSVLAPVLTLCAMAVGMYALFLYQGGSGLSAAGEVSAAAASSPLLRGPWSSAVLYAVCNVFGSFGVMLAMVPLLPDRKKTVMGTGLGAVVLMIPAMCVAASMLAVPESTAEEIPTAYLAGLISPWFRNIYSILMLAAMYSAALGCLVGLLEQLRIRAAGSRSAVWSGRFPYRAVSAAACLGAWALSLMGFGSLIGIIYPLFGWMGIPCVVCLLGKRAGKCH
ncbi:MAG: hypothetical protein IJT43_04870 [Stomatobaculum sp.]|nr:hypothetical protein [Stomatobaculum sp.]